MSQRTFGIVVIAVFAVWFVASIYLLHVNQLINQDARRGLQLFFRLNP